jgi:predicted ester cyclase
VRRGVKAAAKMMSKRDNTHLAYEFFRRVRAPPHNLDAIDELMTEDYRITTAGKVISGRDEFKAWVAEMQKTLAEATNEHLEVFTNATGDRIVSRWITRGANNGMFGLPADGRPVSFAGIAIWRVENGRLANVGSNEARSNSTTAFEGHERDKRATDWMRSEVVSCLLHSHFGAGVLIARDLGCWHQTKVSWKNCLVRRLKDAGQAVAVSSGTS